MADEEDRLPLGLQPVNEVVKRMDFLVAQRRRRLSHDHHAGVDGEGAGDGHQMFRGNAEIAQQGFRIQIGVDALQKRRGPRLHRRPVDQTKAAARRMAEIDVLRHRQLVKQHGFLMDRGHARAGGGIGIGEMHRGSIHRNAALIGLIDPGQYLDHGGFSGAILTDQRGDLSGIKVKLHPREGPHAGESLGDAAQGQHRLGAGLRGRRLRLHDISGH